MIATGSKLNANGSIGDVTLLCPSACIGLPERSTWSMLPNERLPNVATAFTSSRLMLAVKGLARTNVVRARPVWAMSVGKTSLMLRFSDELWQPENTAATIHVNVRVS